MSPQAGSAVSLVEPAEPKSPAAAATADPGEVTAPPSGGGAAATGGGETGDMGGGGGERGTGSAESSRDAAPTPAHAPDPEKKGWIEIVLHTEEGDPAGGTRYRVTLPDQTVADGTLDAKGFARIEGFTEGQCEVTFPDLDEKVWKPK